jgi:glycerol-3-phosphate dehydrogenase (NAD(P)+)
VSGSSDAPKHIAEGAFTATVLQKIAARIGVDMPVVDAVCALLAREASIDVVVSALLARPLRTEG